MCSEWFIRELLFRLHSSGFCRKQRQKLLLSRRIMSLDQFSESLNLGRRNPNIIRAARYCLIPGTVGFGRSLVGRCQLLYEANQYRWAGCLISVERENQCDVLGSGTYIVFYIKQLQVYYVKCSMVRYKSILRASYFAMIKICYAENK